MTFFFLCVAFFLWQHKRDLKREDKALILYSDMKHKIKELSDDPSMSYLKWKEWLPIFEEADLECRRLHSVTARGMYDLADLVRDIIKDDGHKEDVRTAR